MPNAHPPTPGGNEDPAPQPATDLVQQIIDATLSDSRVRRTVSGDGLIVLRKSLLAKELAKPDDLVAAANREEQAAETA